MHLNIYHDSQIEISFLQEDSLVFASPRLAGASLYRARQVNEEFMLEEKILPNFSLHVLHVTMNKPSALEIVFPPGHACIQIKGTGNRKEWYPTAAHLYSGERFTLNAPTGYSKQVLFISGKRWLQDLGFSLELPDFNVLSAPAGKAVSALFRNEFNNSLLDFYYENLLRELLFLWMIEFINQRPPDNPYLKNALLIKEIMLRDLQVHYTIPQLARLVGTNESYLQRDFKIQFKKSVSDWLKEERIDYAKKLLIETGLPVSKICYESGYENLSAFSRAFKLMTGSTPLEWRNNHKNNTA